MSLRHELNVHVSGYLASPGRKVPIGKRCWYELNGSILTRYKRNSTDVIAWERDIAGWSVEIHGRNGISLSVKKTLTVLYSKSSEDREKWYTALRLASKHRLETYYAVGKELGEGGFATVYKGTCKTTGQEVAIKCIDKASSGETYLSREVAILKKLDNNRMCATYEVFETKENLFLVLEYMDGGSLFDFLNDGQPIPETSARKIMKAVLEGIRYLHEIGVAHRDIKPENILLKQKGDLEDVRIADFGLSRFHDEGTLMKTMIGTPEFVAVEVLRDRKYGPEVDLWSCGVLLFNLLTGDVPFDADEVIDIFTEGKATVDFDEKLWGSLSSEALKLTKQLLCPRPQARISALGALSSPWMLQDTPNMASPSIRGLTIRSDENTPMYNQSVPATRCLPPRMRWRVVVSCIRLMLRTNLLSVEGFRSTGSFALVDFSHLDSSASRNSSEWDFSVEEFDVDTRQMSFASESTVASTQSFSGLRLGRTTLRGSKVASKSASLNTTTMFSDSDSNNEPLSTESGYQRASQLSYPKRSSLVVSGFTAACSAASDTRGFQRKREGNASRRNPEGECVSREEHHAPGCQPSSLSSMPDCSPTFYGPPSEQVPMTSAVHASPPQMTEQVPDSPRSLGAGWWSKTRLSGKGSMRSSMKSVTGMKQVFMKARQNNHQ